ncbi:MAG: hypothetical protein E7009_03055 [Alphaproteobacteria bacterium]|nr:hypothetical protein [Alphaproteobacteria bacterium]
MLQSGRHCGRNEIACGGCGGGAYGVVLFGGY